jgi:hypothetical protein
MTLRQLAHSRAGDKGNLVNISVIAYREEDYPKPVVRYCVPNVSALNFVLHRPMTESVTRSLRLDAHGKSLSSLMLSLEI